MLDDGLQWRTSLLNRKAIQDEADEWRFALHQQHETDVAQGFSQKCLRLQLPSFDWKPFLLMSEYDTTAICKCGIARRKFVSSHIVHKL